MVLLSSFSNKVWSIDCQGTLGWEPAHSHSSHRGGGYDLCSEFLAFAGCWLEGPLPCWKGGGLVASNDHLFRWILHHSCFFPIAWPMPSTRLREVASLSTSVFLRTRPMTSSARFGSCLLLVRNSKLFFFHSYVLSLVSCVLTWKMYRLSRISLRPVLPHLLGTFLTHLL